MNATQKHAFTNADLGPKTFKGGRYAFSVAGSFNGGTVEIQGMLPDGVTYATVMLPNGNPALLSAPGWLTLDLSAGQYQIRIVAATGVIAYAASVPL